jgi:methylated-DNA-[protein]-cysteine S-methyltransferase
MGGKMPVSERYQTLASATLADTPIGAVGVAVSPRGLVGVSFGPAGQVDAWQRAARLISPLLDQALAEIDAYLRGERKAFSLPIDWSGLKPFQVQVLQRCAAIPYGSLMTYGQLAAACGRPKGPIAVGSLMASNPMPLVVPCHRVIGSDRRLHGFGAPEGIRTKAYLLELEGHRIHGDRLVEPLADLPLFAGQL